MHDKISHPKHYTQGIECWDYITSHKMGYLEGNIIKYVTRYKDKDGLDDLFKAKAYLQRLIEEQFGPAIVPTVPAGPPSREQLSEGCALDGRNCGFEHPGCACGHPERGICAGSEWPSEEECAGPLDIIGNAWTPPGELAPLDTESYCLGDWHRSADWLKKPWMNE